MELFKRPRISSAGFDPFGFLHGGCGERKAMTKSALIDR